MKQSNININSPVRQIKGKVELYKGSILTQTGSVIYIDDTHPQAKTADITVSSENTTTPGEIEVKRYGKNLFDYEKYIEASRAKYIGEGVFAPPYYNSTVTNKEYLAFIISDIWDLANTLNKNITISFDIKSEIDGTIAVYALGGKSLGGGNRYLASTTEWNRFSFSFNTIYRANDVNGEDCILSFYGTYGTGVIPYVRNIQIEIGENATEYESFTYQSAYAGDDWSIYGIKPISPMTLTTNLENTTITIGYEANQKTNTYSYTDALQSINIERVGDNSKFFGYGICQRLNVKLRDKERAISTNNENSFKVYFASGEEFIDNFPPFYVTETNRDENTNALSITAYDALYNAVDYTVEELGLNSFSLLDFAGACASLLGFSLKIEGVEATKAFSLYYDSGANFEGTESVRSALDAIAEITQTIYFADGSGNLVFKRLDKDGTPALEITKEDYIELDSKTNRKLTNLVSATELEDNLRAGVGASVSGELVRVDNVSQGAHPLTVKAKCKNILDLSKVTKLSAENITIAGDTITIAPGEKIYGVRIFDGLPPLEVGKTYTFSVSDVSVKGSSYGFRFKFEDGTYSNVNKKFITTITPTQGITSVWFYVGSPLATTVEVVISNMMCEEGATATEYEPFINVEGTSVYRCGKNLISRAFHNTVNYPVSSVNGVYITDNLDGSITLNGTATATGWWNFKREASLLPAGKYTLSGNPLTDSANLLFYMEYDGKTYYSTANKAATIDFVPVEGKEFVICLQLNSGATFENLTIAPQLEAGETATEYEPYNAQEALVGADGLAEGLLSTSPVMTLYSGSGAVLECFYYKENTQSGTTQIIRNNPFLDLRADRAQILNEALASVFGLTINQFTCNWRGNFLLEIGDKISFTTKDDKTAVSYLLDDVIEYNGAFTEKTQWSYSSDEAETADNPTSIGEAIYKTYAKVDKANKEILLRVEQNESNYSQLKQTTEGIEATIGKDEEGSEDSGKTLIERISNIKVTAEEAHLGFTNISTNGVDKVKTTTNFVFDEKGLNISKSDNEISTQITEDGMTVSRQGEEVLVANNEGVKAEDLHATTYLIIGLNSRFEDYDNDTRTGCFWIGGLING